MRAAGFEDANDALDASTLLANETHARLCTEFFDHSVRLSQGFEDGGSRLVHGFEHWIGGKMAIPPACAGVGVPESLTSHQQGPLGPAWRTLRIAHSGDSRPLAATAAGSIRVNLSQHFAREQKKSELAEETSCVARAWGHGLRSRAGYRP